MIGRIFHALFIKKSINKTLYLQRDILKIYQKRKITFQATKILEKYLFKYYLRCIYLFYYTIKHNVSMKLITLRDNKT